MNCSPITASQNYFNMFQEIRSSSCAEQSVAFLKILSLATGIIPLIFGAIYLMSLCRRLDTTPPDNSTTSKTDEVATGLLLDSPIQNMIKKLEKGTTTIERKKAFLYSQAITKFEKFDCQPLMQTVSLTSGDKQYLSDCFKDNRYHHPSKQPIRYAWASYDYIGERAGKHFWVNGAHLYLGGDCFGLGFSSEEIMVAEMPEFAGLIAENMDASGKHSTLYMRSMEYPLLSEFVGKATPRPVLLMNAQRVQSVQVKDQDALDLTPTEAFVQPLATEQMVNILALALPRLANELNREKTQLSTIQDLFKTFIYGFYLADQEANPVKSHIHSGKLCDLNNHDYRIVYVLQRLAVSLFPIESLTLHGYTQEEEEKCEAIWNELAPTLNGKDMFECSKIISNFFSKRL